MIQDPFLEKREERLSIHIFTVSAGMVGVCLTVIGIVKILSFSKNAETIADEITATDALLFLTSCMISYFAIKTRDHARRLTLEKIADTFFLFALSLMVAICILIVKR